MMQGKVKAVKGGLAWENVREPNWLELLLAAISPTLKKFIFFIL